MKPQCSFVIQGKRHMRAHRHDVISQDGWVFNVLQNRDVDLRIGLQDRMPRIVEESKQSESEESQPSEPPTLHFCGVFSSCCLVQIRSGFSCSDLLSAVRAS